MDEMQMNLSKNVPAVILAGGKSKPELTAVTGIDNKAMTLLNGKPMIAYILEALEGTKCISEKVVIGEDTLDPILTDLKRLSSSDNFLENIKTGINAVGASGKVLLVSSDIPLIKSRMIDEFVEKSIKLDADFCYPVIPKEDNEAKFPKMKRTYVKLREGTLTGGNIMLVDAGFILRNEEIVKAAFAARKSPLKLAGMIGWGLLFRLVLGLATVTQAEDAAGRLLQGKLRAVITHDPEIGADVDKPMDVTAAEEYLRQS